MRLHSAAVVDIIFVLHLQESGIADSHHILAGPVGRVGRSCHHYAVVAGKTPRAVQVVGYHHAYALPEPVFRRRVLTDVEEYIFAVHILQPGIVRSHHGGSIREHVGFEHGADVTERPFGTVAHIMRYFGI